MLTTKMPNIEMLVQMSVLTISFKLKFLVKIMTIVISKLRNFKTN